MQKIIENTLTKNMLIDSIENNSSNDWDELCEKCSSLVKDANLSFDDIDKIVEKIKKEFN